jgi:hypothetical protein
MEAIRKLSPRAEFFLVTTLCFGYLIVISVAEVFMGKSEFRLTTSKLVFAIAFELIVLATTAVILRARGWTVDRIGLRFSWTAVAAGLPLFIWYMLIYWFTWLFITAVYPSARAVQGPKFTSGAPFVLVASFIVVNSVFEEVTVTGYVVTALAEQGAPLAITASALIRFAYHLYQGPIATISILPLGLLFAGVYWRWRNLWPLMVAHTIANSFALASMTR